VKLYVWPNSKLVSVIKLVEYETSHRPVPDVWAQRLYETSEIQRVNVGWRERHLPLDYEWLDGVAFILTIQV